MAVSAPTTAPTKTTEKGATKHTKTHTKGSKGTGHPSKTGTKSTILGSKPTHSSKTGESTKADQKKVKNDQSNH